MGMAIRRAGLADLGTVFIRGVHIGILVMFFIIMRMRVISVRMSVGFS